MKKENCALKLVDEIILYYDARSKKTSKYINVLDSEYISSWNISSYSFPNPDGDSPSMSRRRLNSYPYANKSYTYTALKERAMRLFGKLITFRNVLIITICHGSQHRHITRTRFIATMLLGP